MEKVVVDEKKKAEWLERIPSEHRIPRVTSEEFFEKVLCALWRLVVTCASLYQRWMEGCNHWLQSFLFFSVIIQLFGTRKGL